LTEIFPGPIQGFERYSGVSWSVRRDGYPRSSSTFCRYSSTNRSATRGTAPPLQQTSRGPTQQIRLCSCRNPPHSRSHNYGVYGAYVIRRRSASH
jgi:hypothetical protein